MRVAHTFEVVQKAKVAAVVRQGGIDPVCRCLIYRRSYPERQTYLHLRGWVGVLLRLLVSPADLRLGSWGFAFRQRGCCQCLAAGRCGWRLGMFRQCEPPCEGNLFRKKIIRRKRQLQDLEVFYLTRCCLSNAWRKLSFNSCCMRQRRAVGKLGCWRAYVRNLGMTPDVSSRRRNTL